MVLSISAEVVGTRDPKTVQVVASGLTVGEAFEIRGSWAGGEWMVRGGNAIAQQTQVVLGDAATPVNTAITYAIVHAGAAAASAPVVVPYDGQYVLQTLDAQSSARFRWLDNGDPRDPRRRTIVFDIPGRARPVVHYDLPAGESGRMRLRTNDDESVALKVLLSTGAPLIMRNDGLVRDLAAVEYLAVTASPNSLSGVDDDRIWELEFELIDDPEPDTVVSTSTWTQFDAAYDSLTWNTFDVEWNALTWNDFDVEDWDSRASTVNALYGFGFGPYGTYPFGM